MLYTDTQRGRFSLGLDWAACRCSHKFDVANAGVRKRKFHRAACDPHTKCHASPGYGGNQVFAKPLTSHSDRISQKPSRPPRSKASCLASVHKQAYSQVV